MPLQIRLIATVCSGPSVGLAFVAASDIPRTLSVWVPVTPYQLRVFENGKELSIIRPLLDLPAARQLWSVGPGRSAEIPCPVMLLFGSDGEDKDGLTWTIRRVPAPSFIEISCGLEVDGVPIEAPAVRVDLAEVHSES